MVSQSFNTGKMSIDHRKYGQEMLYEEEKDAGEPRTSLLDPGPVITNLCISLLVMALLAACFRPFP